MKLVIRKEEDVRKPTWIMVPGNPGMQFAVIQISQMKLAEYSSKSNVPATDSDGNAILADNKNVARIQDDEAMTKEFIELLSSHVVDWKGSNFVDKDGKPVKYSKENFKSIMEYCGQDVIENDKGEVMLDKGGKEQTIMGWLSKSCTDIKTFTEGDSKNSAGSSTN